MPTLDDSFEAVHTALLDRFGPPQTEFESLDTFETMVAVLLNRVMGGTGLKAGLDGLAENGLLTPERLATAEIPEMVDAMRGRGVSRTRAEPGPAPATCSLAGGTS